MAGILKDPKQATSHSHTVVPKIRYANEHSKSPFSFIRVVIFGKRDMGASVCVCTPLYIYMAPVCPNTNPCSTYVPHRPVLVHQEGAPAAHLRHDPQRARGPDGHQAHRLVVRAHRHAAGAWLDMTASRYSYMNGLVDIAMHHPLYTAARVRGRGAGLRPRLPEQRRLRPVCLFVL